MTIQACCRELVTRRISSLAEVAAKELKTRVVTPAIRYTARGTTGGYSDFTVWTMFLNAKFLAANQDEYIKHTVGHEFAHFTAVAMAGRGISPHGRIWKRVMSAFELPAHEFHDYDLAPLQLKRTWKCECKQHYVSSYRHKRLMEGHEYVCPDCDTSVVRM